MDNNISNQNRNQNNNNMGNNFGRGQNRKSMVLCLIVALGIFLVFSLMNRQVEKARDKEISYDQFFSQFCKNEEGELCYRGIPVTSAKQKSDNI